MPETALAPASRQAAPIDAGIVARVILHGDLKQLSDEQKVSYYRAVCDSVGLNPLTQPFQYLVLSGKEILYARREATEQLRQLHSVSITIVGREVVEDCYVVTARATLPTGRTDENIGAVPIAGLRGEVRANAMMKAETKAKRRATLAICGLGMLDESEVASIPSDRIGQSSVAGLAIVEGETPEPAPEPDPEPEPEPGPELPAGYVRIQDVTAAPTKNPHVTRYTVVLSTGEALTTINEWLASSAKVYQRDRTPVRAQTKPTQWGTDLTALEVDEPAPSAPVEAGEIPF
jgi:hypothetical protein